MDSVPVKSSRSASLVKATLARKEKWERMKRAKAIWALNIRRNGRKRPEATQIDSTADDLADGFGKEDDPNMVGQEQETNFEDEPHSVDNMDQNGSLFEPIASLASTILGDMNISQVMTTNYLNVAKGAAVEIVNYSEIMKEFRLVNERLENEIEELGSQLVEAQEECAVLRAELEALKLENRQIRAKFPSITPRKSYLDLTDYTREKKDLQILKYLKQHVRGPRTLTESDENEEVTALLRNLLKLIEQ